MLYDLSDMLLDNEVAFQNLRKVTFIIRDSSYINCVILYIIHANFFTVDCSCFQLSIDIDFENLFQKGISFVCEPFFRSLLINIFHRKFKCVKDETRIEIPLDKGRLMMGSVDETKKLESGQVFIQYSLEPHHLMKNIKTVLGKVIVTKNNCFQPEDLKVFEAVDIPSLRHMVDCIVFSQHGPKPHHSELCDFDGDGYFVCWDERLHSIKNEMQVEYPIVEKNNLNANMTVGDIIEFLANFIHNVNLDVIANSHLVMADLETDGIFSLPCAELANMHSCTVNFLQFGNMPSLQKYRSSEKYQYFVTKSGTPKYIFSNILGKLHKRCRLFHPEAYIQTSFASTDEYELTFQPLSESDIQYAISQRNKYNKNFLQILNVYGIENETEAFTGLIQSLKSRSCFQKEGNQIETIVCAQIALLFERTRKEFFEEFGGINNISVLTSMLILRKALAWFRVTFEEKDIKTKQILSFPWTVGDILCQMKLKGMRDDAFEKIDRNLEAKIKFYESDRNQTSISLQHLRQTVQTNIPHDMHLKWITCPEHGIFLPKCFNEFLEIRNEDLGKCINCLKKIEDISFKADFPREAPFSLPVIINKSLEGFMTLVTDEKIIEMSRNMNKFLCQYPSLRFIAQYVLENLLERVNAVKPNDVVIAWILPIMLLKESLEESVDINNLKASTISYLLLCCLKNSRYFIQKLSTSRELPIISLQWLARNRENILQMCLNIYMEIALCLNVDCSLERGDKYPSSENFFLPVESWGTNVYARTYASSKLMEISEAEIYSSRVSVGDIEGLQLKAIGTDFEIERFYEILHVLAGKTKTLQSSGNGRLSIGETISILFEGAADDHEFIQFEKYQGPCQKSHENMKKHIPRLLHFNPDASRDKDTFQSMLLSQWQKVRNEYSPILHGDLSIVLAFGIFYMVDVKEHSLSISKLKDLFESFPKRLDDFLANKSRYKSRVEYSFSFLPMNSHLDKIKNLLSAHFLKTKAEKIVKVRVSDYGMCDLDDHQNVLQLHLPEIKWFVGQIIRKSEHARRNIVSVRCKMQSYRNLNRKEIKIIEGNEDMINEISSGKLFHKSFTPETYIVKSNKIQYIREKETEMYSNRSLCIENKVWRSLLIEISKISEYEVCPYSTRCTKLPERTEIAIIPPIPDTKATDDEIKNYVDDLWDIALYFGNVIDSF